MKKQLYLYLFIISALINVFTYMYFSKKEVSLKKETDSLLLRKKDSLTLINNQLFNANYFSLENDDNAKEYFYAQNIDFQKLMPVIENQLMEFNNDPNGNKYTDQVKDGDKKFIINKIKILNHRWIIADYSNGDIWGEVLLKYFVDDKNAITFQTIDTYLFPKQKY